MEESGIYYKIYVSDNQPQLRTQDLHITIVLYRWVYIYVPSFDMYNIIDVQTL